MDTVWTDREDTGRRREATRTPYMKRWSGLDIRVDGRSSAAVAGAFGGADRRLTVAVVRETGGIGHGNEALADPDWREFAGTLGSVAEGAVRLGVEWLAAGPGRFPELGIPRLSDLLVQTAG